MSQGPESYILRQITEYLRIRGYLFRRNNSGLVVVPQTDRFKRRVMRMGEKGWPDIIGCDKQGRMFGIEVKAKGNKPTEAQTELLDRMRSNNCIVVVAYDVDDVTRAGL